jgi:hypothetical protein
VPLLAAFAGEVPPAPSVITIEEPAVIKANEYADPPAPPPEAEAVFPSPFIGATAATPPLPPAPTTKISYQPVANGTQVVELVNALELIG